MPRLLRVLALAALFLALGLACSPAAPAGSPEPTARPTAVSKAAVPTATPRPPPTPEPRSRNTPTPVAQLPADIRVTQVLDGLLLPTALTFAPDGRLFFNEVSKGTVRIMDADGTLRPEPFVTLSVTARTEQGALGLALDPDFARNRWVYVFYTQKDGNKDDPRDNRVVRFTERDGLASERTKIVDDLPVGICCHNGGRIAFGPDGKLWVTVGDQNRTEQAQKVTHLHGKILRLNPDGTPPADNPFADRPAPESLIFALGFRNPWGLAFHPRTGVPYVTENGDVGHDEVNRVVPRGNYGSPEVDGAVNDPRFVDPIWDSGVGRIAPTGATFYTGRTMPEYENDLFFCAFNTGDLSRIRLGGPNDDQVVDQSVVTKGCYLDVTNGPDGALYFASPTAIHRFGR